MSKKVVKIPKPLSIFTLAMINLAALGSVKSWPFMAEYGLSSLFYLILAAIVFFFPVSLVSAELASTFPGKGGVYLWGKEAFGTKWGFLAVWLQWVENVVWYPTILSFTASTVAYIFSPSLAESLVYNLLVVLVLFWGATFANLFGMKISGRISDLGAICGTLIPATIIIILGAVWFFQGSPSQIEFSFDSLIPELTLEHTVFFAGILLAFGGMEMSAVHAKDVQNPQRDYPRAILLSVVLVLGLSLLGVLSIAAVIPRTEISLTAGTMQAFSVFLNQYNLKAFIPVIAIVMAIGLFGSVSTWIIGPTKGLLAAGQEGNLPPLFHRTNQHNAPVALLWLQAVIVTVIALMFVLMPTVSSAFWILTVLAAQLYLVMYIILFAAGIRLRYKHPRIERPYKVPGGNVGMWIISMIGIVGSTFALLIGYLPPQQIETGNTAFYVGFLILGTLIGVVAPFVILRFKKSNWQMRKP